VIMTYGESCCSITQPMLPQWLSSILSHNIVSQELVIASGGSHVGSRESKAKQICWSLPVARICFCTSCRQFFGSVWTRSLCFLWAVADHAARYAFDLPLDVYLSKSQPITNIAYWFWLQPMRQWHPGFRTFLCFDWIRVVCIGSCWLCHGRHDNLFSTHWHFLSLLMVQPRLWLRGPCRS
jgi:hypothetical protein